MQEEGRPRLLDVFSGAGGAAVGYHQAGFDVVGVDIRPQPRFPFRFQQADAFEVLADRKFLETFDVVHASPPCQAHTRLRHTTGKDYDDLVPATRDALRAWGGTWVMENVPGAPLRDPVLLCGGMLGLEVIRHRLFESPVPLFSRGCRHERGGTRTGRYVQFGRNSGGAPRQSDREYRAALEVGWMTLVESRQAIPPAYTRYLGAQLLAWLGVQ